MVWLMATKPEPPVNPQVERVASVAVMEVEPTVFDAPIIGYGTVRPKRQVKIIPEVSGRLVEAHSDLAVGNIISKGELLFQIDDRLYVSKKQQIAAEISRLEAQLERTHKEQANLKERLELALEQQELVMRSVERERNLLRQDSGTAPELELAQERYLRQRDAVLAYQSSLNLMPLQVEEIEALLRIKRAQLDEAELSIEKTKIYCPFDARVDAVTAQNSQVVTANFQIALLTDMEALEVSVVIDPRELRWTALEAFASAIGKDIEDAPEAAVTWTMLGQEFSWHGRVTRLERLDETTRTAHVVVELRDIMDSLEVRKGQSRPPLSVGMFCQAKLPTEPLDGALVVPRYAVRDGNNVYVFEPDAQDPSRGHLAVRRVPILRYAGDDVLVSFRGGASATQPAADSAKALCELQPGDQIITSMLPKAVEGMRLVRRGAVESGLAHASASPGVPMPARPHPADAQVDVDAPDASPLQPSVLLGPLAGIDSSR